MYFLIIGTIMAIGWYTPWYESAISPWTTLGPLCFVISISLLQEGNADIGRHRSDSTTNNHRCVVLRRSEDLDAENGERDTNLLDGQDVAVNLTKAYFMSASIQASRTDCQIAFESIKRMNIRQGHVVLIRNREMIPADIVILASSADNGNAYIETSSIDGETNLKLRSSPTLPKDVLEKLRLQTDLEVDSNPTKKHVVRESLEHATKRICLVSALGFPHGPSALDNPANPICSTGEDDEHHLHQHPASGLRLMEKTGNVAGNVARMGFGAVKEMGHMIKSSRLETESREFGTEVRYIAALKTEPPNASVNTFNGLLILPPVQLGGPSVEIPLNAENILLRGAVLRNTEWAIGVACYTGKDTKLVMNSFDTPSKFSRLDQLMNRTVVYILLLVGICIAYLATFSVITNDEMFGQLWCVKCPCLGCRDFKL